jgi:hypothetical protein
MCIAIARTHRVMHTFHIDIESGILTVDDESNLRIIDGEQSGAPEATLAPEAYETLDVNEQDMIVGRQATQLVYTKYTGPKRRNMPEGSRQDYFNVWNVFSECMASYSRAVELAEVFALGRLCGCSLARPPMTLMRLNTLTMSGSLGTARTTPTFFSPLPAICHFP